MWFMADFTHNAYSKVRPYRAGKGQPAIRHFELSTCASTAKIALGQVVAFDETSSATHRIERCSTASGETPILSVLIAGVSAGADPSDGSTGDATYPLGPKRTLPVYIADGDTIFEFPTKLVLASTMLNVAGYELSWDSTLSIHHVSANSTAGDQRVTITGFNPANAGDTGGYVFGRFFSTAVSAVVLQR
jgi:hypothetical protein